MAVSSSNLTVKPAYWLLIIFLIGSYQVLGQKNLSGNLNQPFAHVTALPSMDVVEVDDATGFEAGDTILMIQTHGVQIVTDIPGFGLYWNYLAYPDAASGAHEFMIIQNVTSNTITFTNNRLNLYHLEGNIQIVRVPYYNSATVTGKLFCDPWDPVAKKGGVLAIILGKTLMLNADIDLSGLGLRGAPSSFGVGRLRADDPATTAPFYPMSYPNAGLKGEGSASHDQAGALLTSDYAKGEKWNFNAGGGGNGRYSGGGGGANRGDGGTGGFEDTDLGPGTGGLGGWAISLTNGGSLIDKIFMGGGGGGSTSASGTSGAGGNGGGIVIVVTDTIIGNGGTIITNGGDGAPGSTTGGAGGGGAGGSIAISLMSYGPTASSLFLSSEGGKGGNNETNFGDGGGGGGGLVYVSIPKASNVTALLNGGLHGSSGNSSSTDGLVGELREDFKAVLNGFLFNSVRSSVTGNLIDSVCSNQVPPKITGTTPIGGTPPYTYRWEKSYDKVSWTTLVEDNASLNYTPDAPEANTVYYRRVITDATLPTALVDVSKEVKITVHPYIKNNTIGTDQIICYDQDPAAIVSTATLADGSGLYNFKWEISEDNSSYNTPSGAFDSQSYDASNLKITTWFRRTVTSARCIDVSAPVKVTVLDTIKNNRITSLPQDICYGMTFDDILATTTASAAALAGGDGTYRYKWESNINNSGWLVAPGVGNQAGYNPGELAERAPDNEYLFRRVVLSGAADVCSSTSNVLRLRDYPVIKNNIVSISDDVICSGETPVGIEGSSPTDGDGSYSYTWQDSTKANPVWTDIAGYIKTASDDYQPPPLTDTVRYRRIVYSSACSDISKSIKIIVHKPVTDFAIINADTTICSGSDPNILRATAAAGGAGPGTYSYQWFSRTVSSSYNQVANTGTGNTGTGLNYNPLPLTGTTVYKRQTSSGACIVSDSVIVSVLSNIGNNTISSDQTVCENSIPVPLNGGSLTGGNGAYSYLWQESSDGGTTWSPATGVNSDAGGGYSPSALTVPVSYRRIVKSGSLDCCVDTSNIVSISIFPPLPTGSIVNTDTTIYSGTPVSMKLSLTGSGPWDVTWTENSDEGPVSDITTGEQSVEITPGFADGLDSFVYELKKVTDKNGCEAASLSGKLLVHVFPGFEIPDGFSPNGDGIHDVLTINGLNPQNNHLQKVDLRIVTGNGAEVFHASNDDPEDWREWDGTDNSGKMLPEGTYYYLLKIETVLNRQVYRFSGFIILKRY